MAGFLEEYGVADARRARVFRAISISVLAIVFGTIIGYFVLRTWPAKRQVNTFLEDLRRGDYQAAYRDWGCAEGCDDYPYEKFLEDWGPKGEFADPSGASIKRTSYCKSGDVIVTITSPKGQEVPLFYQRSNGALGFAPWPVCDPRIPAPVAAP
ncbi:MAG TPA: hypothetical protein PLA43_12660 [Bryobacteraceae bacterium]|nr:hypothetical protein [Bryobacteraceae bacterium]HOQ46088.1 hypothetical protein [Bryobacteraceae bacterium]HPQ15755.1 hypothetical protein [Bryobacteraceae bacterium]HPU72801.1 hypothetical protein [Bryobacteraceae bacterium]